MNTLLEKIKEHHVLASVAVLLLAGAVLAFVAWPPGSGGAPPEGQHAGEEHTAEQHAEGHSAKGGHAEGSGHAQEVHLTSGQRGRLRVQTDTLSAGSAAAAGIERPAEVRFDPDRVARIGPRVDAKVERVLVDLGERVEQGEAVAVMSSMKLGKAKSDYLTARAHLETARAEYEREKKLREEGISSEAELLKAKAAFREAKSEVEAAAERLRLYGLSEKSIQNLSANSDRPASQFVLRSPISGRVQERALSPGQSVSASETPIHVTDANTMWAMIQADARDLPMLDKGQDVVLRVSGLPGERFRGQIDFIASKIDEETRTVTARAVIDNEKRKLRAGMYGTATIQTGSNAGDAAQYPMISTDAVQVVGGQKVVFVPGKEKGAFRMQPVQTGAATEGGRVAITSGLQPGAVAVTQGAFDLKSVLTASGRSAAHSH